MKSRILPIAFSVIVLGCGGAATKTNGDSAGASAAGGARSPSGTGSAGDPHSGAGGRVNGIVCPDSAAGFGGTGGALINGAGGAEAASPNVVLACAPDNLSLLLLCTTPIVIGTACDPVPSWTAAKALSSCCAGHWVPACFGRGGYYD